MRILLIGEFSRLHNSLKEGLLKHGHEVIIVGSGDGFKNYPVDISVRPSIFSKPIFKTIAKIFDRLFNIQFIELVYYYKTKKIISKLKGFDVVQLISENSFRTSPKHEIELFKQLSIQNKKLFLLSCGTDYSSVSFALDKKFRYSILTPLFNDKSLKDHYRFILNYVSNPYKKLHEFLFSNINGVIASDLDYHLPLVGNKKYLGLIPNPLNIDTLLYKPQIISDRIIIFHGINRMNYIKKGNRYFEEALDIIKNKYEHRVEIITTENLPYNDYMHHLDHCHILLDQVYAYDQGYNALEAMAKGKVVFTGAEKEWLEYYNIKEDTVVLNALPDVDYLVKKISHLIEHPNSIQSISKGARAFIEKEHNYINIAKKYLKAWSN